MNYTENTNDSLAVQRVQSTVDPFIDETTYQQAGLMAVSLRVDVAELNRRKEMDILIGQIRDAQEFTNV